MYFKAQQSFNKHNDYLFMKIYYRDNSNFMKHKPTPNTGWPLLWGTVDLSHLEKENNVRRSETESFIY